MAADRFVMCNDCGSWKKLQEGNHHPWCACGSDNFRWEDERDHHPEAAPAEQPAARKSALFELRERTAAQRWTDEALLALAKSKGATTYTNRHLPGEPAVAFGNESWKRFCEALRDAHPKEN